MRTESRLVMLVTLVVALGVAAFSFATFMGRSPGVLSAATFVTSAV